MRARARRRSSQPAFSHSIWSSVRLSAPISSEHASPTPSRRGARPPRQTSIDVRWRSRHAARACGICRANACLAPARALSARHARRAISARRELVHGPRVAASACRHERSVRRARRATASSGWSAGFAPDPRASRPHASRRLVAKNPHAKKKRSQQPLRSATSVKAVPTTTAAGAAFNALEESARPARPAADARMSTANKVWRAIKPRWSASRELSTWARRAISRIDAGQVRAAIRGRANAARSRRSESPAATSRARRGRGENRRRATRTTSSARYRRPRRRIRTLGATRRARQRALPVLFFQSGERGVTAAPATTEFAGQATGRATWRRRASSTIRLARSMARASFDRLLVVWLTPTLAHDERAR